MVKQSLGNNKQMDLFEAFVSRDASLDDLAHII
jgi:predicted DNA-binding protein YlxM (UPF0122 family)